MPRVATLDLRATGVTTSNIDREALRVTEEFKNAFLTDREEEFQLVGIPDPFGKRLKGTYEVFWYPKAKALEVLELPELAAYESVYRARHHFHTTMHSRVEARNHQRVDKTLEEKALEQERLRARLECGGGRFSELDALLQKMKIG